MPPRIVPELGLRRFGYRVSILEPDYWVPYPDGSSLTLWGDAGRTAEEIARFSKRDADACLESRGKVAGQRKPTPAPSGTSGSHDLPVCGLEVHAIGAIQTGGEVRGHLAIPAEAGIKCPVGVVPGQSERSLGLTAGNDPSV
jgi:hypothetical protein